jgi:hypothetical protein
MQIEQQFDYRLYSLGWRNGLHGCHHPLQHFFLSIFYLYRRGFSAGSQWVSEYYPERKFKKNLNRF